MKEISDSAPVERGVRRPETIYCETVIEANACGWINPYIGKNNRIYGKKYGNHRVFRCTRKNTNHIDKTIEPVLYENEGVIYCDYFAV